MTRRWIVAMGGGGFSMEPDPSPLDTFALDLARERAGHHAAGVVIAARPLW